MKLFFNIILAILLVSGSAFASELAPGDFEGPFVMNISAPNHPAELKGTQALVFKDGELNKIELALEKPVYGRSSYVSKKQGMALVSINGSSRLVGLYQLQVAPHSWIYVFVTEEDSSTGVYSGKYYKVKGDFDKVAKVLATGATNVPGDWKEIGTVSLKEVK